MPANKVDYIIVGQGLAGTILAHQLIAQGKTVMVIDNQHHQSSSQVAAGIINPITGPRLSLTDKFNRYYPLAKQYYADLSRLLDVQLWQELEQLRLIQNTSQLDYYNNRKSDFEHQQFIGDLATTNLFKDKFGTVEIKHSTVINTKTLIASMRSWLEQQQCYQAMKVDYAQINIDINGFTIDQVHAPIIIFCEGYQAIHNPWLSELPFKLSKGEVLTLETDRPINHLLNWGHWLAPIGDSAKLGSNYQWNDLNLNPSDTIKQLLLDSLNNNTNIKGQAIQHEVGIRPTTTQRQPFVGPLSNLKGAYCFNGFGSKGCLLIPHYAGLLSSHLITNSPLSDELTQWL